MKQLIYSSLCLVLGIMVAACTIGCTSYGFRSSHKAYSSPECSGSFKIKSFCFDRGSVSVERGILCGISPPNRSNLSISCAGDLLEKAEVENALKKRFPDLFNDSESACPLEVSVKLLSLKEGNGELLSLVVLAGSMGTLPCWMGYDELCLVSVRVGDKSAVTCPNETMKLSSLVWGTVYSPIGLLQPRNRNGANGECRFGTVMWTTLPGSGSDTSCVNDKKAVLYAQVAHAIVAALSRCDQNELKRVVLLNSFEE